MRRTKAQPQGKIVAMFPRKRRAGLSPRAYQKRLDLSRLWDLVCMQKSQAEIAQIMDKDPAWVSRSIKKIQADFSTVHATPAEGGIIRENLARWETLYSEARRIAAVSDGFKRISALRLCAEVLRQKAEYEVTVGWVANRRNGKEAHRGPTIEELRNEISDEDLDAVFLIIAKTIERKQAANAKQIPALPQPTKPAQTEAVLVED
jgi:hypothetical protein